MNVSTLGKEQIMSNSTQDETEFYATPAGPVNAPPASEIERFFWTRGMAYQALEQGLTLDELPPFALHYLRQERVWEAEPCEEQIWLEEDANAVGLNKMTCPQCHGNTEI